MIGSITWNFFGRCGTRWSGSGLPRGYVFQMTKIGFKIPFKTPFTAPFTMSTKIPMNACARRPGVLLAVMFLTLTGCGIMEGDPPEISLDREFEVLGRAPDLQLTVSDIRGGVASVRVLLSQGPDMEAAVLVDETFEEAPEGAPVMYDIGRLIADNYSSQEGTASLTVSAIDGSYSGNESSLTREFQFDLYPPQLQVLSPLLYINQGGSENLLYRVSEDAVTSGVEIGPHFFPGFPASIPDDPQAHFALFAFAYDLPVDTAVRVVASDAAGNQSVAGVPNRVSARAFRSRELSVDDGFLQKVVPEIMSQTREVRDQGSLIDTYVEINSRLRELNHARIAELSAASEGEFLWDGGFLQLSNSQVESLFADRRTYLYRGEPVDRQDHVGFDLSVVARYPIEATNTGRVILAEYFGIYGNAVLIDHGAGLISLYGHMSSIDVSPGQMVAKGEILGRSGETGLAGGDHLHFSLFLHGVPVNPIEWWDSRWVEEHVMDRLNVEN